MAASNQINNLAQQVMSGYVTAPVATANAANAANNIGSNGLDLGNATSLASERK